MNQTNGAHKLCSTACTFFPLFCAAAELALLLDEVSIKLRFFLTRVFCVVRFVPWPADALLSVSRTFLDKDTDLADSEKEALAKICVEIHMSVNEMSDR